MMCSRALLFLGLLVGLVSCIKVHKPLVEPKEDLPALIQQIKDRWNPNLDPCNDFYQFVCGKFQDNNPVPKNTTGPYRYVPEFSDIEKHNNDLLGRIVQDDWPLIGELYNSCNSPLVDINSDAVRTLKTWATYIESVSLSNFTATLQLLGALAAIDAEPFFSVEVEDFLQGNGQNYSRYSILLLYMTGATLGVPDNYTPTNPDYVALLNLATRAFVNLESPENARQNAQNVLALESKFAQYSRNRTTTKSTLAALNNVSGFDWSTYFNAISPGILLPQENVQISANPQFLQIFKEFITTQPPLLIYRYLEWKIWQQIDSYNFSSCYLDASPSPICSELFGGVNERTQPAICAELVHLAMTDYIGHIFTLEVINDDVITDVRGLTVNIQNAFKDSLPSLPWLSDQSRASVIFKLQNILQNIGHPNKLERYHGVRLNDDTYFSNVLQVTRALNADQISSWRAPFNRSDEEFDALEVNAFYDPEGNTINFPAGILESPMFSYLWPALFQYARLGYVVGHENTHGFDNQGSLWGPFGFPGDIFDASTRAEFRTHSSCIADLYSKFVVFGNTTVNGNKTLGENIADIGGIKNAYRAYQKYIAQNGPEFSDGTVLPGFSTNQVFWIILGQTWCSVENDAYLALQISRDVHSPSKFRVNGPLSQFEQFAADFKCPANSPMNPQNKCSLW